MAVVFNQSAGIDALLQTTVALPAAAANVSTTAILIGGDGPHKNKMKLKVSLPANSVLVATKTLTITFYDSATTTLAAASPAQSFVITGDTGFAAQDIFFEISQTTKDYVGVNFAVETGGGSNIGTTATVSVVTAN
jgi:hypothetical protein